MIIEKKKHLNCSYTHQNIGTMEVKLVNCNAMSSYGWGKHSLQCDHF